ncbi:MFS transporter [Solirubrobacter ginsenosidimutans]|uniref:MFS transporter n=1 Tax=Solirubrobacter ginsenosidimutans TaxID=490573 RepID=A0A9X3MMD4_9ACTN|nr:MFS transporter [Solirubrobacter ginsenosidimutans]MDA0159094.1 MFS transporter [Solirubrobacter ginsenosidimutans]
MATPYRALLARPGAIRLAAGCALGWLSFTSYALAIVLATEGATGSFAVAGAAVAAFAAASAALAPVRGRLVDRRGARALLVLAPLHAAGLVLVIVGCAGPAWAPVVASGLAGAVVPPVIATARAAWVEVAGPELTPTAHALNAALGDVAAVAGPALTGATAALLGPLVALAAVIPGAATAALLVALTAPDSSRETQPPSSPHRFWGVLGESPGLRTLAVCDGVLGLAFGALDVAVPALAREADATGAAGVPLAAFALGSVACTLWVGATRRHAPAARYLLGTFVVAVALPLCLVFASLLGVTAVLVFAGAGFGLLNVALFELLDGVAAADRAVEALTWLTSAQGAGLAAGAAIGGLLAHRGAHDALFLVAAPTLLTAAIAWGRRAGLRVQVAA